MFNKFKEKLGSFKKALIGTIDKKAVAVEPMLNLYQRKKEFEEDFEEDFEEEIEPVLEETKSKHSLEERKS